MSKVNIKRLDSLSHNDSTATKLINDNFAALQKGIEDSLSRIGKTPNFMDAEFDMNSRRIINVSNPVDETDAVNYGTYKKHIEEAKTAAANALNSEKRAAASAKESIEYTSNAKASAIAAETFAIESKQAAEEAVETVTSGKTDLENIINEGMVEISDTIDTGKEDLNQIIEDGKADLDEAAGNYYTKSEVDAMLEEGGDVDLSDYYNKTESDERYVRSSYYLLNNAKIESEEVNWLPNNPVPPLPDNLEYDAKGWYTVDNMGDYKYVFKGAAPFLHFKDRNVYRTAIVTFDIEDALSGNFAPIANFRREQSFNEKKYWYGVDIYCKEIKLPFNVTVAYV